MRDSEKRGTKVGECELPSEGCLLPFVCWTVEEGATRLLLLLMELVERQYGKERLA